MLRKNIRLIIGNYKYIKRTLKYHDISVLTLIKIKYKYAKCFCNCLTCACIAQCYDNLDTGGYLDEII